MKLHRFVITGFGRFVRWQEELAAGLNVVFGSNESGKTTLHRFIVGMLYGFKEPDHKRRSWRAERDMYEPWRGGPYQGALEFAGADGRLYRVERQFAKERDSVKVVDAVTGKDLSADYPMDKRRELLFAEAHTGMNELIFASTACLGELPGSIGEKGRQELQARLANLRDSGDEATSLRKALKTLTDVREAQVKRCNKAAIRRDAAYARLDEVNRHRADIRQLELALNGAAERWRELEEQRQAAQTALRALDIAALQDRLAKAGDLTEAIRIYEEKAAVLAHRADFPLEWRDEVRQMQGRLDAGRQELAVLQDKVTMLLAEREQALARQAGLPGAAAHSGPADWASAEELFREAQLAWIQQATRLLQAKEGWEAAEAAVASRETTLQSYRGLAELPDNTPALARDISALAAEAGRLIGEIQALGNRCRQMEAQLAQYCATAGRLEAQWTDLAFLARLPADAGETIQAGAAQAQALAESARRQYALAESDFARAEQAVACLTKWADVAAAGLAQLETAEKLADQEQAARVQADAADAAAEAVQMPPAGRQMAGGALLLAGICCGVAAFILVPQRLLLAMLAAVTLLSGGVMLARWRRERILAWQERQRWFDAKGAARATAVKLGANIHDMLAAVGQPSVPAWRTAWQEVETARADQQRAAAVQASLADLLGQRREYERQVLPLMSLAGYAPHPAPPDELYGLPWCADDITVMLEKIQKYRELETARAVLPEQLRAVPEELQSLARAADELETAGKGWHERFAVVASVGAAMPRQTEQERVALQEVAAAGQAVIEAAGAADSAMAANWQALPPVLQPAAVTAALHRMPAWERLAARSAALAVGMEACQAMLAHMVACCAVADLAGVEARWQEWQVARQEAQQARAHCGAASATYQTALQQTRDLLASRIAPLLGEVEIPWPVSPDKTIAANVPAWEDGLRLGVEQVASGRRAAQATAEIAESVRQAQAAVDQKGQELSGWQVDLNCLLARAGVDSLAGFAAACAERVAYQELLAELAAARRELSGVLGDATQPQLASQLAAWQAEQLAMTGKDGDPAIPALAKPEWEEILQSAMDKLTSVNNNIIELQNDIKNHLRGCEGEEQVVAELDTATQEHATAALAREALELAQRELASAAEEMHRQFAPQLNARASAILADLTGGRYEQVMVADTLDIQVIDPGSARQVPAAAVSRGTYDQLYLAFRLAAAEMICQNRFHPPFLVDDAFAHYDDGRAREGLRTLLNLSRLTQVVFFTCRGRDVNMLDDLAREEGIPFHLVTLAGPEAQEPARQT